MLRYLCLGFVLCQGCSRQPDTAANSGAPAPATSAEQSNAPATASAEQPSAPGSAEEPSPAASAEPKAAGAKQPKWTMIKGIKACTGTILSMFVCTPPKRPPQCSEATWKELNDLTGKEKLTPCALEPDIIACSVPIDGEANSRCFPAKHPASCPDDKWARVKDDKLVSPCQ